MARSWVRVVTVSAFGIALGSFGCRQPKVSLATGPREYTDSDYAQVLER